MDVNNSLSVPFARSYWVIPGRFLAGFYPGSSDELVVQRNMAALNQHGVDVCIDLTATDELLPYETAWLKEAQEFGRTVSYLRRTIPDFSVPTRVFMRTLLDEIDAQLNAGRCIYVHCWGGIGRTGTVVGCYLVRHGLSGEQALAEISRLRANGSKMLRPSPETDEQYTMVLTWQG